MFDLTTDQDGNLKVPPIIASFVQNNPRAAAKLLNDAADAGEAANAAASDASTGPGAVPPQIASAIDSTPAGGDSLVKRSKVGEHLNSVQPNAADEKNVNAPAPVPPVIAKAVGLSGEPVDISGMAAKPSVIPKPPAPQTASGVVASSPDYPVPAEIANATAAMSKPNDELAPVPPLIAGALGQKPDLSALTAPDNTRPVLQKSFWQKVQDKLPAIFTTLGIVGGGLEASSSPGHQAPGAEMFKNSLEAAANRQLQNRKLSIEQQNADTNKGYKDLAGKQFETEEIPDPTDPTGQRTITVLKKNAGQVAGAMIGAGSRVKVAEINAENRIDVQGMKNLIAQGKVSKVEDAIDASTGRLGKAAYNAQGRLIGFLEGAMPSASLLPKSTATTQYMLDADNNIIGIPKNTQTAPVLPGAGSGASVPASVPGGPATPPRVRAATPTPTPNASLNPPAAPPAAVPPKGAIVAKPVYGANGQPLGGKGAKDAGYAFDPKSGFTYYTTRDVATSNGYLNFNTVKSPQLRQDTQLNAQLSDVAQKTVRYEDAYNAMAQSHPDDANRIAYLLNTDKFKLGAFGAEIPVDEINTFLKQHQLGTLSPEGVKTYNAYLQARESLTGYNKVLSGSARNNEKQLELLLQALPDPTQPANVVRDGLGQFKENVHIAGNGLPVIPGTKRWNEYLGERRPTPQSQQPGGNGGNYLPWFKPIR